MRFLLCFSLAMSFSTSRANDGDTLVYGGTPAGIAAALAAAKEGDRVQFVQPEPGRIGGLLTNGLSHTDFRTFESLTGTYLDFAERVVAHYRETHGDEAEKVSFRGTQAEPKVNLAILQEMLAEETSITVTTGLVIDAVQQSAPDAAGRSRLESVTFVDVSGKRVTMKARVFIDATYEGDLMAAVGEEWVAGREGRDVYGEPLGAERTDGQLQAYNFRLMMTDDPANRVEPQMPAGYRREDFAGVLDRFADGRLKGVFGPKPGYVYKIQFPTLPNGKWDINDVSLSSVRLSLPGANLAWPDGGSEGFSREAQTRAREAIFAEHVRWNVGLLYFLQHDEAVPTALREEARAWGWCRDEFTETGGLPDQLYVREARRLVGARVFTEKDTDYAPGDARAVFHADSIAMGDYGPNCHGSGREGTVFDGKHTGEFYKPVAPYQIPYGTLVPKRSGNLLVPGAMSSSHVGFCALRYEPIWMSLGQAAGIAASLAGRGDRSVQDVPVAEIQARLWESGAATLYVSDVPRDHPDFVAVQWWGGLGGWHGLAATPEKPGQRGEQIEGQYFEAFPGHEVEWDRALTPELRSRWIALLEKAGLPTDALPSGDGRTTRGDFVRSAWSHSSEKAPR